MLERDGFMIAKDFPFVKDLQFISCKSFTIMARAGGRHRAAWPSRAPALTWASVITAPWPLCRPVGYAKAGDAPARSGRQVCLLEVALGRGAGK